MDATQTATTGDQLGHRTEAPSGDDTDQNDSELGTGANRGGADGRGRTALVTAGWTVHWLLRLAVALELLVYGWSKVFLMQMGRADFSDALVTHGEMSPMGLLWRFVGYSPLFQVLSGCAEVLAGALLLWRRTAWLGALVGMFDMGFVFILNMAYDVPVKQLSLGLAIASGLIALPFGPRLLRIVAGKAAAASPLPKVFPWPKVDRVTRWTGALFAVAVLVLSGWAFGQRAGGVTEDGQLAGTYRVTQDAKAPAPQLAQDDRWQQVAIGQWKVSDSQHVSIRQANGDLRRGTIRFTGSDRVDLELGPVQRGAMTSEQRQQTQTTSLTYRTEVDGSLHLEGAGQNLTLKSDPESRFLFDRDYQWAPRVPVNR